MLKSKKRNPMKKALAALLSAAMVAGSCPAVFAQEETADAARSVGLSGLRIVYGDQTIDLSDMNLELDVSDKEFSNGGCVHLDMAGETMAEIGFGIVDDLYVLHLESPSLGSKDYVVDPEVAMAQTLDQGISALIGVLQTVDTKAIAHGLVSHSMDLKGLAEEETEAQTEAQDGAEAGDQTAQLEISVNDVAKVIGECLTETNDVEMGGTLQGASGRELTIAEGVYDRKELTIDTDALCKILDTVSVDGQLGAASEQIRKDGIEALLDIDVLQGKTDDLNKVVSLSLKFNDEKQVDYDINFDINGSAEKNGKTADVFITGKTGGQDVGLDFTVTKGMHEGEMFSADTIDMENAIVLTDMESEEADREMQTAMTTVGMDMIGVVAGPIISMVMSNLDLSAFGIGAEAETETVTE